MAVIKKRTKVYKGKKFKYCIEFTPYNLKFYLPFSNYIYIELKETGLGEEETAIKLLKTMYKLLDMDIDSIKKYLKINFKEGLIVNGKTNEELEKIYV